MKATWTIFVSLTPIFSDILTRSFPFCSFNYYNVICLILSVIGYFLFRHETVKGSNKNGLLGIIIMTGFGWIVYFTQSYEYCINYRSTLLNVLTLFVTYVILLVGYGLTERKNHNKP